MASSNYVLREISPASLDFARNDLAMDKVIRNVPGFFDKYFHVQLQTTSIQKILQQQEIAQFISTFNVEVLRNTQKEGLHKWILKFQALMGDTTRLTFQCQPAPESEKTSEFHQYIQAKSKDRPGEYIEIFGEYHHSGNGESKLDDNECLLRFFSRVQQVFAQQPTRRFLHAFMIWNSMLELWVFDRSGALSSGMLILEEAQDLLGRTLTTYAMMDDTDLGLNNFLKYDAVPGSGCRIIFDSSSSLYLRSNPIAVPDYIVGPGTTCYAASRSKEEEPSMVVKFSWRKSEKYSELNVLKHVSKLDVQGTIRLVNVQDNLENFADLHKGLQLPGTFQDSIQSCIVTAPLGVPLQKFASSPELLDVLADTVEALRSLYIDGGLLHRDLAIKNIVITSNTGKDRNRGVLIDLDSARNATDALHTDKWKGSDGFMAINVLLGAPHTYQTDLEALFYVFLWLVIGNEREYPHPTIILFNLSGKSHLRNWVSQNYHAAAQAKIADMSLQGFQNILHEFSTDFIHLRGLAEELHSLIFRPDENGTATLVADESQAAAERLYRDMSAALRKQSSNEMRGMRSLLS